MGAISRRKLSFLSDYKLPLSQESPKRSMCALSQGKAPFIWAVPPVSLMLSQRPVQLGAEEFHAEGACFSPL